MENRCKNCLSEALCDLIALQDLISNYQSKYYGQYLVEIIGGDTIPLLLITNKCAPLRLLDKTMQLETMFFRIESIDKECCCVTVTLLRAYDYEGHHTNSIVDVVRLERTTTERTIELCGIVAIQPLSPDLLKRNIIIEPKW
ncbi:CotY/CotZ family spore coat protein [Lysinibacillus sp. NPDC097287]|uniref:CotY/CotZ family spore coat protein n=1 Tax=Lysinibacillus sp. NPDC097287 TaxID=3364144 RepID=UPI00381A2466